MNVNIKAWGKSHLIHKQPHFPEMIILDKAIKHGVDDLEMISVIVFSSHSNKLCNHFIAVATINGDINQE